MDSFVKNDYIYVTRDNSRGGTHTIEIPLEALVSWKTLLELDSYEEAFEYIVNEAIQNELEEEGGKTGYNWEEVYSSLLKRDYIPSVEEIEAIVRGKAEDPRSPLLRSKIAAFKGKKEREATLDSVKQGAPKLRYLEAAKKVISSDLRAHIETSIKPRTLDSIHTLLGDMAESELASRGITSEEVQAWKSTSKIY